MPRAAMLLRNHRIIAQEHRLQTRHETPQLLPHPRENLTPRLRIMTLPVLLEMRCQFLPLGHELMSRQL